MDRGTYGAAAGGLLQLRRLDLISHNLANINSPGYKQQMLIASRESFDDTIAGLIPRVDFYARGDHDRTPGVVHVRAVTDFSPGPHKFTGNPLDVALRSPNEFFVVITPEGEQLTRAGNFTLSAEGTLVTQEGFPVKGAGGPLVVTEPGAAITESGALLANRLAVGNLEVVRVDNLDALERVGGGRFRLPAGAPPPPAVEPQLAAGALEMPNVTAVGSIIELIAASRAFELYTKAATSIDSLNQASISQVGRRNQ